MKKEVDVFSKAPLPSKLPSDSDNSMKDLARAMNHMTDLFQTAAEDIKTESASDIGGRLDVLIKQNEDIAKALLLILELNREHLPNIHKHVKTSAEAAQRRPPEPRSDPVGPRPRVYQTAGYKMPGPDAELPPPPPPQA